MELLLSGLPELQKCLSLPIVDCYLLFTKDQCAIFMANPFLTMIVQEGLYNKVLYSPDLHNCLFDI